ncbi:PAS domain-containing sensor histidine kinase [Arsenicicoccus piscis]|uniref:sensor histidine kinase n=1 Tax=Arsenicicoccus piscis TaxID=673954 RepID=UPI001F4CA0D3|nr:PAS domain-containing sensor histidine kinase [Arsenicicoccus piscis]MCH8628305.1 PAS domain-containing sensor histidine kinase [Arsenicicoccus piscis]
MATLTDVLRDETSLSDYEIDWLRFLVGDWQIISDLAFADLVLWVPTTAGEWLAVAHVRPTTGRMVFVEDVVGTRTPKTRRPLLNEAMKTRRIVRDQDPGWLDDDGIRQDAIPVVCAGRAVAMVSRCTNPAYLRVPSRLELIYQTTGDALCTMIASGDYPHKEVPTGLRRGSPRVSDGLIRLDIEGHVTYASPNAISALHRLGHNGVVVGESLAEIATSVLRDHAPVDETLALVVTGRAPWRTEIETRAAHVTLRAIPLTQRGTRSGAAILLRDVSELRRRERELMTKDATIREIHHRVKNNLQTVAAVLRLQARRLPEGEARTALDEAVRRVGTIALVHETLSRGFDEMVDFDDIARRAINSFVDVARTDVPVHTRLIGSFGRLRAEDATSLSMIVTELVSNAVEHGLAESGGTLTIEATREADPTPEEEDGEVLTVTVTDDGAGVPEGWSPEGKGLGTQIVSSLVEDLRGRITWERGDPAGTRVQFTARLRPPRD